MQLVANRNISHLLQCAEKEHQFLYKQLWLIHCLCFQVFQSDITRTVQKPLRTMAHSTHQVIDIMLTPQTAVSANKTITGLIVFCLYINKELQDYVPHRYHRWYINFRCRYNKTGTPRWLEKQDHDKGTFPFGALFKKKLGHVKACNASVNSLVNY